MTAGLDALNCAQKDVHFGTTLEEGKIDDLDQAPSYKFVSSELRTGAMEVTRSFAPCAPYGTRLQVLFLPKSGARTERVKVGRGRLEKSTLIAEESIRVENASVWAPNLEECPIKMSHARSWKV
ncbi:hypothetical protein PHLCEN_2v3584 [Hermanssonia centrifuga]|uniref:Uncharacterized protein n=1 Tax=Hermanssonia centrifuga TaxID=98765 RepID=A0A2R6QEP9_9APHY|nr:hypothetical protein PHLCEN_2v3584 [Hermanssonia centrifuga]